MESFSKTELEELYKVFLLTYAGNIKLKDFKARMDLKEILARDYRKDTLSKLDSKIPVSGMFIGIKDESRKYKLDKDLKPINLLSPHIESFCERYEILEHINEHKKTYGFRASLFFDKQTKEYFLTIAGTDMCEHAFFKELDLWDIYADFCIFSFCLPYLQFSNMLKFYKDLKQKYVLDETNFYVLGHSLGGYLAQILSLAFFDKIKKGYFFQSPGARDFYLGLFARSKLTSFEKEVLKNYKANKKRKDLESKLVDITTFKNADSKHYLQKNFIQLFGKKVACKRYELYLGRFDTHHPGCALLPVYDYLKLSHN
ncbi:hypothetical protein BKH43_01290 [Helicobacter sp. 13S00401-1]|uniref:hypothetical protein n=1 Tax=Helicobacter sp. 13S00401-1 TaxID=1905758 RepID=UPI000BA5366E|nr:hypothetical protein [Helicobacter sp. 13S00401-1]PAF51894.1 hypothetical protein BKH43_01290 [Helicobacter sp. 13S00401-1]